jgi:LysM repeat protein
MARPTGYVVKPGDSLWGIASKFLKDPYRWGELWKLNAEEIKNPQRIYPGQVIALDKSGNQPRSSWKPSSSRGANTSIRSARASLPFAAQDIEPFLSEPRVIDDNGVLDIAPRVVALQDNRVVAGAGDTVYATEGRHGQALAHIPPRRSAL